MYNLSTLAQILPTAVDNMRTDVYATLLSCVDLTTLTCCDTDNSVRNFAERAVSLYGKYPTLECVASICVYPNFVEAVGMVIDGTPMKITAVAGGFPASQTFLEVKALEVAMAIESGADEVDIVLSVGKVLEGSYEEVESELRLLRNEASDATLKVILETGELRDLKFIYDASLVAMNAGADFIKTSTGKTDVSATPEATFVMCCAIKQYLSTSGRKVGIKVAGGIKTIDQAVVYYTIVKEVLGDEWLTPNLFRVGTSSLANSLLSAVVNEDVTLF